MTKKLSKDLSEPITGPLYRPFTSATEEAAAVLDARAYEIDEVADRALSEKIEENLRAIAVEIRVASNWLWKRHNEMEDSE